MKTSPLLTHYAQAVQEKTHYLNILDLGDDALLARLHLIRTAQKTIFIQTFIWKYDEIGLKFLQELLNAARRGVEVRLLIDFWIINKQHRIAGLLAVDHANFQVRYYNPPTQRIRINVFDVLGKAIVDFEGINQRMHNKIFAVDGEIAIIGGRNYDNTYYDRGETRNFIDLDVMFAGPVVGEVVRSFDEFWNGKLSVDALSFEDVERITLKESLREIETDPLLTASKIFDRADREADDHTVINQRFVKKTVKSENVKFIYDPPGKLVDGRHEGGGVSAQRLAEFLRQAEKKILIQSPYLVLSRDSVSLVKALRKERKNIDIMVSTNSMATTDNIYAYAFLFKEKKQYVKDLHFRIFELKPVPADVRRFMAAEFLPGIKEDAREHAEFTDENDLKHWSKHLCVHSKIFAVDDKRVWVGTFNADVRSENINTEMALIIDDENVTRIISQKIERIMRPENSWTVGPKKYIPILTEINDELTTFSQHFPVIDIWPFRNVTCFDLKEGKKEVPVFSRGFYSNYKNVGPFPGVAGRLKEKEIKIRLMQMFGQIMKPIV